MVLNPNYSAKDLLSKKVAAMLALGVTALSILLISSKLAISSFVIVSNFVFFISVSYKVYLFVCGMKTPPDKLQNTTQEFPIYTILVPLFREEGTIKTLIKYISELDYPYEKLDVKFVVERGDEITLNALKIAEIPSYSEIIEVPFSLPQTKPKACNYALQFAKGEFVTIFDAEDRPHKNQLNLALNHFRNSDKKLVCVQAQLNYYNYSNNILTLWFALEYGIWFNNLIKALSRLNLPIPLGGTSNHFKAEKLKEIGAWDAYNVTEDADLGYRMAAFGYRAEYVNSITMEECPAEIIPWIKQRTRWIKGFMQTYIVHMKNAKKLIAEAGIKGFLSLQFLIGIPVIMHFLMPWIIFFMAYFMISNEQLKLSYEANLFCNFNLYYAPIAHILMALITAKNMKFIFQKNMVFAAISMPFYFILHIVAGFRALYQLITAPYYWDKTEHGKQVNTVD